MRSSARMIGIAGGISQRDRFGRDDWIRTSDPLTPSQVRYQAAPHPDRERIPSKADACDWRSERCLFA
jgi:hypothetical protein